VSDISEYYPPWDDETGAIIRAMVGDFVFCDHRLASHPTVEVGLYIAFRGRNDRTLLRKGANLVASYAGRK